MLKKILQKIFQKEIEELANKKSVDSLMALRTELDHYKNVLPAYRLKLAEFHAVNSELHLTITELNNRINYEQREPNNYTIN
jgi:isocitrate/isopropylmalate dehydrogenase